MFFCEKKQEPRLINMFCADVCAFLCSKHAVGSIYLLPSRLSATLHIWLSKNGDYIDLEWIAKTTGIQVTPAQKASIILHAYDSTNELVAASCSGVLSSLAYRSVPAYVETVCGHLYAYIIYMYTCVVCWPYMYTCAVY